MKNKSCFFWIELKIWLKKKNFAAPKISVSLNLKNGEGNDCLTSLSVEDHEFSKKARKAKKSEVAKVESLKARAGKESQAYDGSEDAEQAKREYPVRERGPVDVNPESGGGTLRQATTQAKPWRGEEPQLTEPGNWQMSVVLTELGR